MDTLMIILLIAFTFSGFGVILYRMDKTIKELKAATPNGELTQDAAFSAFTELLIDMIPEFVAGYQSILSEANSDETKLKIVIETIVSDIMVFINTERHSDPKIESIYKLVQLVPRDIVVSSLSASVLQFIEKYLKDEKEKEDAIVDALAAENGIE
jgi:hypothetical protein